MICYWDLITWKGKSIINHDDYTKLVGLDPEADCEEVRKVYDCFTNSLTKQDIIENDFSRNTGFIQLFFRQ